MNVAESSPALVVCHFRSPLFSGRKHHPVVATYRCHPLLPRPLHWSSSPSPRYPLRFLFRRHSACFHPLDASPPGKRRVIRRSSNSDDPYAAVEDDDDDGSGDELPNPPDNGRAGKGVRRTGAVATLDKQLSEGLPPPYAAYLMVLGVNPNELRRMVRKYPGLAKLSVDKKIMPVVEFLLHDLKAPRAELPLILCKYPQLLKYSVKMKLLPAKAFLEENKCVDKSCWAMTIRRYPQLLTRGKENAKAIMEYFTELGLSTEGISASISHFPQILGLSVEGNIRVKTKFFLEKGFTIEEIQRMVSKFGYIYSYELERNLIPKWEFFLETGYPPSDLVLFPQYFGYSLEGRIKPRYNRMSELGIRLPLSTLLNHADRQFDRML